MTALEHRVTLRTEETREPSTARAHQYKGNKGVPAALSSLEPSELYDLGWFRTVTVLPVKPPSQSPSLRWGRARLQAEGKGV